MIAVMFLDSPIVLNSRIDFENVVYESIENLFGVRSTNLNQSFSDSLFIAVTDRFIGMTILDLQNAFRYAEIEKKQYVSLTRDEVLKPIQEYWVKKSQVSSVLDRFHLVEKEEIDRLEKEKSFYLQAKNKYILSLQESVLHLDEFECASIARNFSECLPYDIKPMMVKEAKNEHISRVKKDEGNQFSIVPSWQQIYSRMFIEICLNKGIKFIEV